MGMKENLRRIRKDRGLSQAALASASGLSQQLISQIERGENEKTAELPALAKALGVAVWDIDPDYIDDGPAGPVLQIPIISWVSAGKLEIPDGPEVLGEIQAANLPAGDWIALKVTGSSMDRISPPESVILVNRRDKALVPNACYVIVGPDGAASYKRFRPNPMRFEPVSVDTAMETFFPDQEPEIVGRVRRTILDM